MWGAKRAPQPFATGLHPDIFRTAWNAASCRDPAQKLPTRSIAARINVSPREEHETFRNYTGPTWTQFSGSALSNYYDKSGGQRSKQGRSHPSPSRHPGLGRLPGSLSPRRCKTRRGCEGPSARYARITPKCVSFSNVPPRSTRESQMNDSATRDLCTRWPAPGFVQVREPKPPPRGSSFSGAHGGQRVGVS